MASIKQSLEDTVTALGLAVTALNSTVTRLDTMVSILSGAYDYVNGEVVNETPNGVLLTFTVDAVFVDGTEVVNVGGLIKVRGALYDYTTNGAAKQIIFNAGKAPTQTVSVSYIEA
jgi:hypothetical protein